MNMRTQLAQKEIFEESEKNVSFQFRVFKNQEYVRLNGFKQSKITIGRSPDADLVLDDGSVEEIHADVALKGGLFFLTNYKPNNGLRVNGQSTKKIKLKDRDVIDIGPFSMVFNPISPAGHKTKKAKAALYEKKSPKLTAIASKQDSVSSDGLNASDTYAVILKNEYTESSEKEKIAERLGIIFRKSTDKMIPLLGRPKKIVKRDVSYESALRLQKIFEMAGAECLLEPMHALTEARVEAKKQNPVYEVDEEDEDDIPADFNLIDKLTASTLSKRFATKQATAGSFSQLEVIKSIGSRVVDVQFISKGRRYRTENGKNRLKLAELTLSNKGFASFPESWNGYLLSNGKQANLKNYKTEKYLYRKKQRLYRLPISFGETLVAADGYCEYRIRHGVRSESPKIASVAKEKAITWRHWSVSGGFHLLFLLIACIIFAINSRTPEEENLHFVKIDMSQFEQQPPVVEVKEPPKKPEVIPKAEPPKIEPVKKAPEVKKAAPKKPVETAKSTPRATPKVKGGSEKAATNSHPDAGGGFGEGNIQNRNINQTGLLSLLGDGASSSSSSVAIAEVTNLDAVEVPGASGKQFSVGGIKGSLGNGKISLASGEAVQTKGGKQVLRSAGVEGPGTVAALERGEIGNKQVRGMVTAKMSKTVSIQGGMSREMVKRVIDQHLDEIQYCYESALLENSAIMGRIVYEWKILMSGQVGEVRIVSSSVNSHVIHNCIKESIKTWQFPKPVGSEVVVSYPFVFDLVGF
jgi:pSer/pThr/pTyr-binding forkhead associated (FHA) protein/outer membrane biosynthesis protein TonB